MKVVHAGNVYHVELLENEWYGLSDPLRAVLTAEIQLNANDLGCRYVNVVVQPDELFSNLPDPKRHQVWKYTFPLKIEDDFYAKLMELAGTYVGHDKLTLTQAKVIAKRVFG